MGRTSQSLKLSPNGQKQRIEASQLTSTGFGDIVPVHHPAKTVVVFQQIVGTLYVAILIARLIDAYPSARRD